MIQPPHTEPHRSHRVGWLRAAVLGANDGIVSTSSLIIGVASANSSQESILLAGLAGLVAGAMSMAAGEYVSVSSQADTEKADIAIEKRSLSENYEQEKAELANIYQARGLSDALAKQVADELMAHDALGAHARDEIGIVEDNQARPIQAGILSALTFTVGALLPLLVAWLASPTQLIAWVALSSLIFLALLGSIAAVIGGANIINAAVRVTIWGALAMVATAGIGHWFDVIA